MCSLVDLLNLVVVEFFMSLIVVFVFCVFRCGGMDFCVVWNCLDCLVFLEFKLFLRIARVGVVVFCLSLEKFKFVVCMIICLKKVKYVV